MRHTCSPGLASTEGERRLEELRGEAARGVRRAFVGPRHGPRPSGHGWPHCCWQQRCGAGMVRTNWMCVNCGRWCALTVFRGHEACGIGLSARARASGAGGAGCAHRGVWQWAARGACGRAGTKLSKFACGLSRLGEGRILHLVDRHPRSGRIRNFAPIFRKSSGCEKIFLPWGTLQKTGQDSEFCPSWVLRLLSSRK